MLVKCPECNNDISTETTFCPHCGFPFKEFYITSQIPERHITANGGRTKIDICNGELIINGIYRNKITDFQIKKSQMIKYGWLYELLVHNQTLSLKFIKEEYQNYQVLNDVFQKCGVKYITAEDKHNKETNSQSEKTVKKYGPKCPKCGSYNLQHLGVENVGAREATVKTTTKLNLNPLKPFTLFNHKEKVVRPASSGITYDRWRCSDCGKVFRK